MCDTDAGAHTLIVARADVGIDNVDDLVGVWRSHPFSHCAITARSDRDPDIADRFVETLLSMDPTDPNVADMMKREHLTRWVTAEDSGWDDLTAAVEQAGLVGQTF